MSSSELHAGTARTPFAASIDGRYCFTGNTEDEAVASACADLAEVAASDGIERADFPGGIEVLVYVDVLWCTGPDDGEDDCHCGASHIDADGRWTLFDWKSRHKITESAEVWLDEDVI